MELSANGVSYHLETQGKGEAVLLLHGFTGDSGTWTSLGKSLERNFHVLKPDIIGHGASEAPNDPGRYSMDNAAADIASILEQAGIQQVHVVGYSMGGRLALFFACRYPEKVASLVLESSSPGLKSAEERVARRKHDDLLAQKILDEGMEAFVDYWESIPLFASQKRLSPKLFRAQRSQRLDNRPLGLANSLRGMGTGSQPSMWDCLKNLDMPVLLICGELDQKFCAIANDMNSRLPDCELVVIENAGHAIHVEEAKIFDTIVTEFLIRKSSTY